MHLLSKILINCTFILISIYKYEVAYVLCQYVVQSVSVTTISYLFSHFMQLPWSSFPQFPKAFPAALTSSKQASWAGLAPRNTTYPIIPLLSGCLFVFLLLTVLAMFSSTDNEYVLTHKPLGNRHRQLMLTLATCLSTAETITAHHKQCKP